MGSQVEKPGPKQSLQALCDEIYAEVDPLACYIFDAAGSVLGSNYGRVKASKELRSRYPVITGVVWGSLLNIEEAGGKMSSLLVTFEKFKVLGFPLPGRDLGVVLTLRLADDPVSTMYKTIGFVEAKLGKR